MHGDADGSWLIRNAAAYRHLERQPVGGELLTIEAAIMPGKGRVTVTGNLRDVMRESISAAASYVRSRAVAFGIKPPLRARKRQLKAGQRLRLVKAPNWRAAAGARSSSAVEIGECNQKSDPGVVFPFDITVADRDARHLASSSGTLGEPECRPFRPTTVVHQLPTP